MLLHGGILLGSGREFRLARQPSLAHHVRSAGGLRSKPCCGGPGFRVCKVECASEVVDYYVVASCFCSVVISTEAIAAAPQIGQIYIHRCASTSANEFLDFCANSFSRTAWVQGCFWKGHHGSASDPAP